MKIVYATACILHNNSREFLIVQRPPNKDMGGFWEFPGGKLEKDETPEQSLTRELWEELGIVTKSTDFKPFCFVSYQYPNFHLILLVYSCHDWLGEVCLREGQPNLSWIRPTQLKDYNMLPSNEFITTNLLSLF